MITNSNNSNNSNNDRFSSKKKDILSIIIYLAITAAIVAILVIAVVGNVFGSVTITGPSWNIQSGLVDALVNFTYPNGTVAMLEPY
jgi:uncharacterized BrkB/YihY/UPF0761 family membrane protein